MSLPRFGGHPERDYSPRRSASAEKKFTPRIIKKDAVRRLIARGSKTITEIAKELGVSPSMLHRWRERYEPELTGGAQPSQGEREEIERLRSELRDLKAENSLSKKAAPPLGDHRIVTTLCPGGKERMRRLMELVRTGRLDLAPLLTHSFSLDDLGEAYALFGDRREGVIKVAIRP